MHVSMIQLRASLKTWFLYFRTQSMDERILATGKQTLLNIRGGKTFLTGRTIQQWIQLPRDVLCHLPWRCSRGCFNLDSYAEWKGRPNSMIPSYVNMSALQMIVLSWCGPATINSKRTLHLESRESQKWYKNVSKSGKKNRNWFPLDNKMGKQSFLLGHFSDNF